MQTVGILLAAGRSVRFGADKRQALFRGLPLIEHAARAMRQARLDHRIVVGAPLAGFQVVDVQGLQSDSLRAGVQAALGAQRILIALADMPLVDAALLDEVVANCPPGGASAAQDGGPPMPPACFDVALFPALLELSGDRGAGALLRGLAPSCIVPAPGKLADVDRPEDLSRISRTG